MYVVIGSVSVKVRVMVSINIELFALYLIHRYSVDVNVNVQYLSTRKVVFSKLQNCADFSDGDFRDGDSAFQHMGPETVNSREPYVTVLVRGKSSSPWVAARR